MKKTILTLLAVLSICACTRSQQEKLGLRNSSPDESVVEVKNPLVVPPSFGKRPEVK